MATTITSRGLLNQFCSGTYTGTGSSQDIEVGFDPIMVWIFNQTDGDTLVFSNSAMTAATGVSVTTPAAITNGITFGTKKFTVGTDSSVNENNDTFCFFAI